MEATITPVKLRRPQVRVLQALAKANRGFNRAEISEKGNVDRPMLNSYLGAHDEEVRAANDEKNYPCLLTLKFVHYVPSEAENGGGHYYGITAAGRKALEKAID